MTLLRDGEILVQREYAYGLYPNVKAAYLALRGSLQDCTVKP